MSRPPVIPVLALIVALIGVVIYWQQSSVKKAGTKPGDANSSSESRASGGDSDPGEMPQNLRDGTTHLDFAKASAEQSRQIAEMGFTPGMTKEEARQLITNWDRIQRDTLAEDWRKPIEFFGKVVDQNAQPVEGVSVRFLWTDTSVNGSSEASELSDARGQFALSGVTGRTLQVWLTKDGYYVPKTNRNNFDFATGYLADPNNPVVFGLVKKGEGVDLITAQSGIRPDFTVAVPKDGNLVRVDILQRKAGSAGQMEVQSWIETDPTTHRTTSWRLRLAIPGGGFVEHQDEFPFMAPEEGYQPELVFSPPTASNVRFGFSRKTYYIAFGQPRRYGRIEISASASTGNLMFQYAINPDGSRYLEPK